MRKTLASAGIAATGTADFAAGAQQGSAEQQASDAEADIDAFSRPALLSRAGAGSTVDVEQEAEPQQSSAAGMATAPGWAFDMKPLETLKWV
jgi:hypothetical protein